MKSDEDKHLVVLRLFICMVTFPQVLFWEKQTKQVMTTKKKEVDENKEKWEKFRECLVQLKYDGERERERQRDAPLVELRQGLIQSRRHWRCFQHRRLLAGRLLVGTSILRCISLSVSLSLSLWQCVCNSATPFTLEGSKFTLLWFA